MRHLLLLSFAASVAAAAVIAGCGDDPGFSDLPYAYSIDATPDGVVGADDDAGINRH